jgi:quinol monooxygenase YgiN
MAVTVTLALAIKKERLDEFKGVIKDALPDTRAFDGCQSVDVYENHDKPGEIFLVERWDSKEHQQKYIAWREETGMMDALGTFLATPPTFAFYTKLDV